MEGMGGLREKGGRDRGEEERNDGRVSIGESGFGLLRRLMLGVKKVGQKVRLGV